MRTSHMIRALAGTAVLALVVAGCGDDGDGGDGGWRERRHQ